MKTIKNILTIICLLCVLTSCQDDCAKADKLRLQNKFEEAVELYQKAADQGNAYAKWRLSKAYSNGDGLDFDENKAAQLLLEAADGDCDEAKCELAFAYMFEWFNDIEKDIDKGKSILDKLVKETDNSYVLSRYASLLLTGTEPYEEDKEKAVNILDKVKDKSNPLYLDTMGDVYLLGTDKIDIDEEKAVDYYERGFAKGRFYCAAKLASLYSAGSGKIQKDQAKMIEWLKKGIESNVTDCMLNYSDICLSKDSTYQEFHNPQKGIELLKKAAKHGNGQAYFLLGNYYHQGEDLPKDDEKAFENWEKATNLRNPNGASNLAYAYFNGIGCEKNDKKAVEIFKKAVDWGSGFSANKLFYIYLNGLLGEQKDKELAKKYLLKSAELGDDWGCYNLGSQYYYGNALVEQNYGQAFIYVKLAADKGLVDACAMLSYFYEQGIGCNKDPEKAKEYKDKTIVKEEKEKD